AVEAQPQTGRLAVAEPADARRQSLEGHVLLGQRKPAMEPRVRWELFERGAIGGEDVGRIARQRGPAERSLAEAEERTNELGHEPGIRERLIVRQAALLGFVAQAVPVVEQ